MSQIKDALEAAAGAGDEEISSMRCMERGDMRTQPSKRRIGGARIVIRMFLEGVPPEMTAAEMLEGLEE
jgi:hypothetical protein